jgi:DNA repair protein RecO (recombination protein O)
MSEIVKTEAVVLSKLNYSDSSKIVSLFTLSNGRMSAIVKGGRGKNSKTGTIVDPLNVIDVVFYKKESREIQLVSDGVLLLHNSNIREDFERLKYSYAVLELVRNLTLENEANERLFNGIKRILFLLDTEKELPEVLFCRFFFFFLQEIGYEIQVKQCSVCHKDLTKNGTFFFNYDKGMICANCGENHITNYSIPTELFSYFVCLKHSQSKLIWDRSILGKVISLLESFTKFHVTDFKGLNSLKM